MKFFSLMSCSPDSLPYVRCGLFFSPWQLFGLITETVVATLACMRVLVSQGAIGLLRPASFKELYHNSRLYMSTV
ncbi:hypothetical protein SMITH_449 [Smithella sp. ME-1]|uniref:Uncharacterized protein n=1 Tax=hydrocarbon metagenome TaxID=938273 RepID=A0A0W8FLB5_9ZZZZ|nr:hypothetical protein SMITH_449 [Smithella sp. ME-1]